MSGKNTERPELHRMMDYVREGDTVIVESFSRFARNTQDLLNLTSALKAKGVQFVSQKENIDTNTHAGKFISNALDREGPTHDEREQEYIRTIKRKVQKRAGELDTLGLLWKMTEESEDRLIDHFSRCFSDTQFMRMGKLENQIKQSGFKRENKEIMLDLASRLQRTQSVDKALEKMEKKGMDTSGVLDRFAKLGISPIPLRKKFCAESLPGPMKLLKHVSDGAIPVDYIKVKYK